MCFKCILDFYICLNGQNFSQFHGYPELWIICVFDLFITYVP